jgi:hypothetical protein
MGSAAERGLVNVNAVPRIAGILLLLPNPHVDKHGLA